MMHGNRKCDHCSDRAITHITDPSAHPVVISHSCEKHTPSEYRQAIDGLARSVWNNPTDRESVIDFMANELGLPRDEVRQELEYGFDQLDRRG